MNNVHILEWCVFSDFCVLTYDCKILEVSYISLGHGKSDYGNTGWKVRL